MTTPRVRRAHPRSTRLVAIAGLVVLASTALTAGVPGFADADDSNTLTVVGTSDVSDSGLVGAILQPGFEQFEKTQKHHSVTFDYVPQGTGAAIQTAESGAASALIVHAESLENSFVGQGYSEEPFGRAIFFGDYVVLGPKTDPAGVAAVDSHDVVSALEKIARAGAQHKADLISRGGTPGTTVEEHALWALTTTSKIPAGTTLCPVSSTNGGGKVPSSDATCQSTTSFPSWYHVTGANQALNVQDADSCNGDNNSSGSSTPDCYVLTDRGTFDNLESEGALANLKTVVRDNRATARGGSTVLVNSFHAYAVNPAKFSDDSNVAINVALAEDFLDWVTSPSVQARIGTYLAKFSPPFVGDAAPKLTGSTLHTTKVGHRLTVTGTLSNRVPGTPTLSGERVDLLARANKAGSEFHTVAHTSTGRKGHFTLHSRPTKTLRYRVATGSIVKLENANLSPVFGDELQPTSTGLGVGHLRSVVSVSTLAHSLGRVTLRAALHPQSTSRAKLEVFAGKAGHALHRVATRRLTPGRRHATVHVTLPTGARWRLQVRYVDTAAFRTGRSGVHSVDLG